MHPYYYEQLIHDRHNELTRAAARVQLSQPAARHHIRQNAGWLLVHVGLKLALGREARSAATRPA
jgi:methenyltetrahydromethanopterin cyclohydrolase